MQFFVYVFAFLLAVAPSSTHAEEINAGFVQGLWYSSDQIIENIPIRIYAAFRNNTPHDLTGTIRFIDNGKRIGSAPVSALSGRLVETWIDWTPTYGEHTLSVTLSDAELHVIGGEIIQVDVADIMVSDMPVVDHDTDTDGIGDTKDMDDDGDGITDTDEVTEGTDPLIANPKAKEESEEDEDVAETPTPEVTQADKAGLEKYLEDGVTDTLLGNVTDKVTSAKQSLDAYREERNTTQSTAEETALGTNDNATITRSSIETKNSFLSSFVSGVASLLRSIYTFVLWILSSALAHPAFIQLFLLISILYMFYRTARKFGRRQY